MRSAPVNLLGGFNRDDAPGWSVQDVVNWLPVVADQQGTRTQYKLRTPPGLKPYQRIGSAPSRGIHNVEGRLFAVLGQTLYEITAKGVGIPRGTVPGVGRVRMAHNQVKNGHQLAIANGQAGYIYNTATLVFTRITDDGFPGAIDVKFIDGYLFWLEPFGRYWLHSDLADGLSYNTLDRGEAESQPDRLVGLAVNHGEVTLFGERTTEFYGNTGQATGTFQSKGVTADVGCASLHTIQNLDNSVMWLGNDGVVYRLEGYRAVPISTRALERTTAQYDWRNAFAFTWEDEGHKAYYLTFPDGETFGYDVVVGLWHRRESMDFKRWRLNHVVSWGRQWIGTDFQDGRLWLLDWDYVLEGFDELVSEYTTGVFHDDGNSVGLPEAQFLFDTGGTPTAPIGFPVQPVGPSVSGSAPDGVSGQPYAAYSYAAVAGSSPVVGFSIADGALPPGFSLSASGVLAASPAGAAGAYTFVVRATDANGLWAEVTDSIVVIEPVVYSSEFKYTVESGGPSNPNNYSAVAFDDSSWASGKGGFGNTASTVPGQTLNTVTASGSGTTIWLRKHIQATGVKLRIDVYHDDGATLWWNGVQKALTLQTHPYHHYCVIDAADVAADNVVALRVWDMYDAGGAPSGTPNIYASLEVGAAP